MNIKITFSAPDSDFKGSVDMTTDPENAAEFIIHNMNLQGIRPSSELIGQLEVLGETLNTAWRETPYTEKR